MGPYANAASTVRKNRHDLLDVLATRQFGREDETNAISCAELAAGELHRILQDALVMNLVLRQDREAAIELPFGELASILRQHPHHAGFVVESVQHAHRVGRRIPSPHHRWRQRSGERQHGGLQRSRRQRGWRHCRWRHRHWHSGERDGRRRHGSTQGHSRGRHRSLHLQPCRLWLLRRHCGGRHHYWDGNSGHVVRRRLQGHCVESCWSSLGTPGKR
mmetsp:Transcript_32086/g.81026  ORF Transcript_32086/g.81026 Transcript_32086/m.81026 type:complete len:218 (+) Transcript_32086:633-1286(+)